MAKKKKKKNKLIVCRGKNIAIKVTKKKNRLVTTHSSSAKLKPGQIGSFGGIIFKVSEKKALPMQNIKQEINAKWSLHEILGSKPKAEFSGPELRTFTLDTIVDVQLGYKPHSIIKKMNRLCEKGKVDNLIIGSHKIGAYKWKLEKVSEAFDLIYSGGELARAKLSLTLSEYV